MYELLAFLCRYWYSLSKLEKAVFLVDNASKDRIFEFLIREPFGGGNGNVSLIPKQSMARKIKIGMDIL